MDNNIMLQPFIKGSYNPFLCVKILNYKQACFYVSQGVRLRDIKLSYSEKTKEPLFVYYFYREDTKEAYDKWCNNNRKE